MAFQRLNIRAKKSFPGLYSSDNVDSCHTSKSAAVHYESSPRSDLAHDVNDCDLEDFGARAERCKDPPSKDSPSKRKMLFGSLRSLRSLANLHSSPSKTKHIETERAESPVKHPGPCTTPLPTSPSLALLNLEQSPPGRPIFELNLHQRSVSSSSLEVLHSSPVTVPGSARQMTPYSLFPSVTDLPAGTIPNTPGPMQRAFDREPANHILWQNASPTPIERFAPSTPVLTPLPGTNLSIGDVDPDLVPLPPSINPSVVQIDQGNPGYFDIPVDEQLQMDNADRLNGLACLRLADDHGDNVNNENSGPKDTSTHVRTGYGGISEKMRGEHRDAKLQNTANRLDVSQNRTRALRRKQQTKNSDDAVRAQYVPRHHQILPLRLKQQNADLQDRVRKDSATSEDGETCSGERSTSVASEQTHERPNQSTRTSVPANDTTPASPQDPKRTKDGNSPPVNSAYIVLDSLSECRRNPIRASIWGRHTGLYDGTGYGSDDSGPATPYELDESTKDVNMHSTPGSIEVLPAASSVVGDHSGKDISSRPQTGEDPYLGRVQKTSPLTANEQRKHGSLESIYRAYAYPSGNRVPSSSNNSTNGNVQRSASKEAEISS